MEATTDTVSNDTGATQLRKAVDDALACIDSIRGLVTACRWTEVDEEIIGGTAVLIDAILLKPLEVVTDSDEYQCLKSAVGEARHVMNSAEELVENVWRHSRPVPTPVVFAVLTMVEEMLRIAARTSAPEHVAITDPSVSAATSQEVGHGQ